MGVDAEMFVRLKGRDKWLKPEHELAAAYELASTIGADNFVVNFSETDGKLPSGGHHALSIVRPIKDKADARDNGLGSEIIAAPDEQFIRVHLWTRYYGPSYARGNWPVIRMTMEWLQLRFPEAEIWYGGDSSGICAEHMTADRIKEFNDFFLESGRKTYQRAFTSLGLDGAPPACPCCLTVTNNCGGGSDCGFFYCDGCGQKFIKEHANRTVHLLGSHVEFFDASANLRDGKPVRTPRKAA
jgi:hypothetical protein